MFKDVIDIASLTVRIIVALLVVSSVFLAVPFAFAAYFQLNGLLLGIAFIWWCMLALSFKKKDITLMRVK